MPHDGLNICDHIKHKIRYEMSSQKKNLEFLMNLLKNNNKFMNVFPK